MEAVKGDWLIDMEFRLQISQTLLNCIRLLSHLISLQMRGVKRCIPSGIGFAIGIYVQVGSKTPCCYANGLTTKNCYIGWDSAAGVQCIAQPIAFLDLRLLILFREAVVVLS